MPSTSNPALVQAREISLESLFTFTNQNRTIMIYYMQFTYEGMEYNYSLNTEELDRNFEDESTAYWLIHPLFEINIYRNEDTGELTTEGYVKPYATEDDFENDRFDFDELIPIHFIPA